MTYVLWFLVALSILSLGYAYVGWRLIVPAALTAPWKTVAWTVLVLWWALPPLMIFLEVNRIEAPWSDALSWIAYVGLGFFSIVFTIVLIRDLAWLAVIGVQGISTLARGLLRSNSALSEPLDAERRKFLMQSMSLGILVVSGGLVGYGIYEARRRPAVKEIFVTLLNLPPDLEGFRIVQITDIHAGLTVRRPFVQTVVDMANSLSPDLIAFTGDLADGSVPHLRDDVAPLADLSAHHGRYFITGNHEYYSGAEQWVKEAERLGFAVLLNEHRIVQEGEGRILLAGVTDYSGGQFIPSHKSNPQAAVAGAPPSHVKILLAHQPRSLYAALPLGFDLQISGHTHGGQFFPWNLLATVGQPYIKGFHNHKGTWIYVSRGTGYWGPPIRLAARSEITVFTLTTRPQREGTIT
jgi:predicted MPP superfamily phosphohydrolase